MKRVQSDGINKKSNKHLIEEFKCPVCYHDRAWISRSETGRASYNLKCTKCGRYHK